MSRSTRIARSIGLTALVLAAPARLLAACGIALGAEVGGPFPGVDSEGRVWLGQLLSEAPLEDPAPGKPAPATLALRAYWSPRIALDAPPGPLGTRWFCPLLESSCRPSGPDAFELIKPDGYSQPLTVTRRREAGREVFPRTLSGGTWSGTLAQNKEIRLTASCGAKLAYDHRGRLTEATVDGRAYTWVYSGDHLQEIRTASRPLFTFRYDDTGRLAGFSRPGERATVRFADIPVDLSPKREVLSRPALARIEFENAGSLAFDFALDPASGLASADFPALGHAVWQHPDALLQKLADTTYHITPHPGNPGGAEFKITAQGKPTKQYYNNTTQGELTYTQPDGTIWKENSICSGPNRGLLRSISKITPEGEVIIEKRNYDEKSRPICISTNDQETYSSYDKNGRLDKVWTNTGIECRYIYDKKGRQIRCTRKDHGNTTTFLTVHKDKPDFNKLYTIARPSSANQEATDKSNEINITHDTESKQFHIEITPWIFTPTTQAIFEEFNQKTPHE